MQFPLKRLLKAIVGDDAKLLVSSEWNFVPFTYPMTIENLPQFALVGTPAYESGNALTIPLAGHELGHSAWRVHDQRSVYEPRLIAAVEESLSEKSQQVKHLKDQLGMGDLSLGRIRHLCVLNGLKQLEEIFCDAVGLYTFGPSYLYATEYFLAPGGRPRSLTYPSDVDRLWLLNGGAKELKLTTSGPLFERWQDSVLPTNQSRDFVVILDHSVKKIAPDVVRGAFDLLAGRKVPVCRMEEVARVKSAFSRGEPDAGEATLAELATAGWETIRENEGMASDERQEDYRVLGDLMLKSVEVSEFNLRVTNAKHA